MDVVGATGWLGALAARPDGGRPLPAEEALALAATLANRLAEEHAAGMVHARSLPAVLQAPEVLAGGRPGPAADVYALTAGLWTLLTGRPPHVRDGEDDVPPAQLAARRAQPPDDVPGLPAPVTALLRRGLATDPAERPHDAAALAAALDDCAGLVDYARRRELGQRFRPRPVTPRPAAEVPLGPVTPVDPLPVLGVRRRGPRVALVLALVAVAAGVAVLLVPGLRGPAPAPRTTPGPGSSFDVVVPAGGTSPLATVPGATTGPSASGGPAPGTAPGGVVSGGGGAAPSAGTTAGSSAGASQPAAGGGGAPSAGGTSSSTPASTTTSSPGTDPNVPPVVPPTRATVPPITDTFPGPPPTA